MKKSESIRKKSPKSSSRLLKTTKVRSGVRSHAKTRQTKKSPLHLWGLRVYVGAMCLLVIATGLAIGAHLVAQKQSKAVLASTATSDNPVVEVKLRDDSGIQLLRGQFSVDSSIDVRIKSVVGVKANALNNIVRNSKAINSRPLFSKDAKQLKREYKTQRTKGKSVADLSQYVRITLPKGTNTKAFIAQLKAQQYIEDAYDAPKPVKPPATANFTTKQLYRTPAPVGVSRSSTLTWPGSKGDRVKIADIEYSWNKNHEDLSRLRATGAFLNSGVDPFKDTGHGTAVAGQLVGDENAYGITGLVPYATFRAVAANTAAGYFPADAINIATNNLSAGDVILIEQQAYGYNNQFVPIEIIPSVYDAIRVAVAKGIIVVEAAGNGNENLDDPARYRQPFPNGRADSGAIIVGAGSGCDPATGNPPRRARMDFSTYGKRVNLQGWGSCVVTTAYGDLYSNKVNINADYTSNFAGTSSASPIVAAAAASFSSSYERLNGVAPSPALVRQTLMSTGTPQAVGAGTLSGNIGPVPNLAKALLATDKTAPTKPTNFKVVLNSNNKPVVSWTASTDNVGVAKYNIYRNDVLFGTSTGTTFTNTSALAKTTYRYKVAAVDKSGNISAVTSNIYITTR